MLRHHFRPLHASRSMTVNAAESQAFRQWRLRAASNQAGLLPIDLGNCE